MKIFFKQEMPYPNNEKYLVKIIGYKLEYVVYGFTTTAIANLSSVASIGPRVKKISLPVAFIVGSLVILEENYPCNVL